MSFRTAFVTVALAGLGFLAACSGNGGSTAVVSPVCGGASTFCLIECNLGCRLAGDCAISEIAQNQVLQLSFSQTIDPSTVNASTLSLSTANGESPSGEFTVQGSTIVFQPTASSAGGSTVFGFRPNETYLLSIAGPGAGDTIRSDSGDPVSTPVFCQLNVSRGLIDLDQRAPTAELLNDPEVRLGQMGEIELLFSELLDPSVFVGITPSSSPITFQIRATVPDLADPTELVCASSGATGLINAIPTLSIDTTGQQPRSVVSLVPGDPLPGASCVRVTISSRVRDIAGTPAAPESFDLIVEDGGAAPFTVTESFGVDTFLESTQTGAQLVAGDLIPADIGGTGRMGAFTVALANQVSANEFELDTDNTIIPAGRTLFGNEIVVTDGVFEFSEFVVEEGEILRFVGDAPPTILVSGRVDIRGQVVVDGSSPVLFTGRSVPALAARAGQPGASGGPGGGAGGKGGDSGNGTDNDLFDGSDGEPGRPPMTSGYSGLLANTPGRGAELFPSDGVAAAMFYQGIPLTSLASNGGGGGGAFVENGTVGFRVAPTGSPPANRPIDQGANTNGGAPVGFQPLPMGLRSIEHFLVGGSGGGGGGSGIFGTESGDTAALNAGAGGAGGGGAIGFRAGGTISLSTLASGVSARGGSGVLRGIQLLTAAEVLSNPGGAGSGGSIVFQSGQGFNSLGALDVSGGTGGEISTRLFFDAASTTRVVAGNGSPGLVYLELPTMPALSDLGTVVGPSMLPAGSVGALDPTDRDPMTSVLSRFRPSGRIIPPSFTHYRLTARVNGMTRVFTDESPVDPSSFATFANGPIEVMFQGATVSPGTSTGEDAGPFRSFVNPEAGPSINADVPTGFRFLILFDRTMGDDIAIEELVVFGDG
ncbi:MAG: Ig-like domain-containing protein [Planctomycetota bacterium]